MDGISDKFNRMRTHPAGNLFAFSFIGVVALMTVPIAFNPVNAIIGAIQGYFEFVLGGFVREIFNLVGKLFVGITAQFLVITPVPGTGEMGLTPVWQKFHILFWAILPVSGMTFFATMQIFPENQEADIWRFFERSFAAIVALIATSPTLANFTGNAVGVDVNLYTAAVVATNRIIKFIQPDNYTIGFLAEGSAGLVGGLVETGLGRVSGAAVIIIVLVLVWYLGVGILTNVVLVLATFWLILAMRLILVAVTFAMMPLLLALWIVDVGPLKYGKMLSEIMFKVTAVLLLFGIVITGVLATSGAIAQNSHTVAGVPQDTEIPESPVSENGTIAVNNSTYAPGTSPASAAAANTNALKLVFVKLFAWVGGLVLSIALVTSGLGMLISTRSGGGTASRIRQGRSPDASTGMQAHGEAGGAAGGAVVGNQAAPGSGQPAPSQVVSDGEQVAQVNADNSAAVGTMGGGDGDVSDFDSQPPEQIPDEVPLNQKARNLGGRAKQKASSAAETAKGSAKKVDEKITDKAGLDGDSTGLSGEGDKTIKRGTGGRATWEAKQAKKAGGDVKEKAGQFAETAKQKGNKFAEVDAPTKGKELGRGANQKISGMTDGPGSDIAGWGAEKTGKYLGKAPAAARDAVKSSAHAAKQTAKHGVGAAKLAGVSMAQPTPEARVARLKQGLQKSDVLKRGPGEMGQGSGAGTGERPMGVDNVMDGFNEEEFSKFSEQEPFMSDNMGDDQIDGSTGGRDVSKQSVGFGQEAEEMSQQEPTERFEQDMQSDKSRSSQKDNDDGDDEGPVFGL